MKKMIHYAKIIFLSYVLLINVTGFSSAAFFDWINSEGDVSRHVGVNDMPPQWEQDLLEFISCGRIEF